MRGGEADHSGEAGWRERLNLRNKLSADEMRKAKAKRFHRDIATELANEPRATDEQVTFLASLCARRIAELAADTSSNDAPPVQATWFDLFRRVDTDGSGKIDFKEFRSMVRLELGLCASQIEETAIKAVWLALDEDSSGHITTGEFAAFARKAGVERDNKRLLYEAQRKALASELRAHDQSQRARTEAMRARKAAERHQRAKAAADESRQRITAAAHEREQSNREAAAEVRYQVRQEGLSNALDGVSPASKEELTALAEACAAQARP
jgi:hypothetical protein